MIFDIHGDIWTDVTIKSLEGQRNIIRNHHLERFKKGEMIGGIFVVWTDPPHDMRPGGRLKETILAMSKEIYDARDFLMVMRTTDDYHQAVKENKLAVMLGLEGISSIGEDLDMLYVLYQLGFRHVSLTWNEENDLATGTEGNPSRGLTEKGVEAVQIINDLGMILDVSHANDQTFDDIMAITEGPIIASHSNARSLCDVPRNLTDDQIKLIGQRNGLIGINAFHQFIDLNPDYRTVDRLIDHLEHIVNLIGIKKVALGFDFFEYLPSETTGSFAGGTNATKGLEDYSKTANLIKKLKDRGFSDDDLERIAYKNFLELTDRVQASKETQSKKIKV